jgi:hypothetical protein
MNMNSNSGKQLCKRKIQLADGDEHINFAARGTLTLEVPSLNALKKVRHGEQRKTVATGNIFNIGNLKW